MPTFRVVAVLPVSQLARFYRARLALAAGYYCDFSDYEHWHLGTKRLCHRIAVEDAGVPNHGPREDEA